ncbi:hypothetical protein Tco_1257311 [Tanacetum coccineum]
MEPTPSPIPILSSHTDPLPPIIEPTATSSPKEDTNIPPSDHDQPSSLRLNEPDGERLTSTFIEDETAGGSFHESPPKSHEATPTIGQPSGLAEDPVTLTSLASLVYMLMQKTKSLESELKVEVSDSEEETEQQFDVESFLNLATASMDKPHSKFVTLGKDKASVQDMEEEISPDTLDSSPGLDFFKDLFDDQEVTPGSETNATVNLSAEAPLPTGSVPIPTGSSSIPADDPVTMGSIPLPTGSVPITTGSSSIPTADPITTRSGTTSDTPLSPVRDARKGKGPAVDEPTPTQEKTFKQLEEERLGWEAAQRLQA